MFTFKKFKFILRLKVMLMFICYC